jgi:hypothetical protein
VQADEDRAGRVEIASRREVDDGFAAALTRVRTLEDQRPEAFGRVLGDPETRRLTTRDASLVAAHVDVEDKLVLALGHGYDRGRSRASDRRARDGVPVDPDGAAAGARRDLERLAGSVADEADANFVASRSERRTGQIAPGSAPPHAAVRRTRADVRRLEVHAPNFGVRRERRTARVRS